MRVLQINYSDHYRGGGAAVAVHRIHTGLKMAGIESHILSYVKTTDSPDTAAIPHLARLEHHLSGITGWLGLNDLHGLRAFRINGHRFFRESDIVNFHILHGGYFNYLALPRLTRKRRAVLTLHDMWNFTGHCSYSYECGRWESGCGQCPHLDSYPPVRRDMTAFEWKLKKWTYGRSDLHLVAPSRWLAGLLQKSMLSRFAVEVIPNGVDTDAYHPLDRDSCRNALGIPGNKKVLLFTAMDVADRRKGYDLLVAALRRLPDSLKAGIVLVSLGGNESAAPPVDGVPTVRLGFVSSDRMKCAAYSAADVLLFPSRADNLPLSVLESMSCGTPVVCFNVGGLPDAVRQGVTGSLARAEDPADFSDSIARLLEDERLRQHLSRQCREVATQEYTLRLQVERYIRLYERIFKTDAQA